MSLGYNRVGMAKMPNPTQIFLTLKKKGDKVEIGFAHPISPYPVPNVYKYIIWSFIYIYIYIISSIYIYKTKAFEAPTIFHLSIKKKKIERKNY